MNKKDYERCLDDIHKILCIMIQEQEHPTKFLCEVMETFYGHKIKVKDLINLIENSEVKK